MIRRLINYDGNDDGDLLGVGDTSQNLIFDEEIAADSTYAYLVTTPWSH